MSVSLELFDVGAAAARPPDWDRFEVEIAAAHWADCARLRRRVARGQRVSTAQRHREASALGEIGSGLGIPPDASRRVTVGLALTPLMGWAAVRAEAAALVAAERQRVPAT
jgi:hypothetical protein